MAVGDIGLLFFRSLHFSCIVLIYFASVLEDGFDLAFDYMNFTSGNSHVPLINKAEMQHAAVVSGIEVFSRIQITFFSVLSKAILSFCMESSSLFSTENAIHQESTIISNTVISS